MQVGQSVVCVDGYFPGPLAKHYVNLPVKGKTYTIRSVYIGRAILHGKPGASDGEIGVLLQELVNPPDPRNKHGLELGFKAERFRPLQEMDTSTEKKDEMVLVASGAKSEPLKEIPLPYSPETSSSSRNSQKGATSIPARLL